jgi:hypothetical protein
MRFVNEPTSVDARFDADGGVRLRRFTWEGGWLDVSDVGRQWQDAAGRHVLVMVGGRRTFELLLEQESLTWRVVRAPETLAAA